MMRRFLGWTFCVLAALLPVGLAIGGAYWQAEHDQSDRVRLLASIVLSRAEATTDQMSAAFAQLATLGPHAVCTPEGIRTMRRIDLGSSLLQGVGFVQGNKLLCSSLDGNTVYDLGAPGIVTGPGNILRPQRELPLAPGTPVLTVTSPDGYTAFIHPALIFVLSDAGRNFPIGIAVNSTREALLWTAPTGVLWSRVDMPEGVMAAVTVADGQLVAWKRSERRDLFGYASVPLSAVWAEFGRLALPYGLGGLLAGLLLGWAARQIGLSRASLPALLRAGLARGEIFVMYQPIVDLDSGRWIGAEALARWRRRSGEWVPPDIFIPIAERHGLIGAVTQRVVELATADFGPLMREHDLFLSINVAPADLRTPRLGETLHRVCRLERLRPALIHLELTEREDASDPVLVEAAAQLRGTGYRIGLDDFGVGYSNLAYLDALPLDYIKIDRAFMGNAAQRGPGSEILDHMIDLAQSRRLDVIAEGVETQEQRAGLLERGVRHAQGWLFGKPMSFADFRAARPTSFTPPLMKPVPASEAA